MRLGRLCVCVCACACVCVSVLNRLEGAGASSSIIGALIVTNTIF